MRRKAVWAIFALLAFSLQLSARVPEAVKSWMKPEIVNLPVEYVDEDGFLHKQTAQPGGIVIDTVQYLGNIAATANDYPSAGDYAATYYRPAADGMITDVFVPFGSGGDVEFHIMRDTIITNASGVQRAFWNINRCIVDSINGFLGSMVWSIKDDWATTHGDTAVALGDSLKPENFSHLNMNTDVTLGRGGIPVQEYYRIWVGYKKLAATVSDIWGRSYDYGYAAGEYSTPHSYFTYGQDWSGPIVGPYLIYWGSGSYYGDALMKIVFEYPNGTPPQVLGMTRPNNTYDLAGNKSVTATIADADGTIASANLMYAVSAGAATYQSVAMTYNDTKGTWTGTISGSFAAGDTVYYYVEATDNDGKARNNQSGKQYFRIMAPENAQAQILVVLESEDDQAVYETILAKLGKQYELWVVPDNNGIDATIIAHPQWKTILWNAHGSAYMFYPQYTKDVLANYKPIWKQIFTFLDNGGSLFYSDYDYFYTCASGTDSTMDLAGTSVGVSIGKVGETHAGYSYFGVQTFWSDPCLVTDAYYPKGEKDFAGVASDPITNDWASTDLTAVDRTDHWGDYVEVAPNSKKILTGKAYGYDVGTRTSNGTWATVFLPWNFSILADTTGGANTSPDAEKLMKNILDYLDAKTSGIDDDPFYTNPMRTELFSNYPNPFNPTTELSFSLAQAGTVQLEIYDIVGQKVKTLVNDYKSVGTYRLSWNGLDDSGNKVSSGVYFYRLKTTDYTKTQKMMFLK